MGGIFSKIISFILAVFFSGVIVLPIEKQNIIYVDGMSGSDSAAGSFFTPVKTISKALELVDEKNTIHVIRGTFDETVEINKDGITLEADKNANVTITGGKMLSGKWEKYKGRIFRKYVDEDVKSVFVGNEQMIIARWPNAECLPQL